MLPAILDRFRAKLHHLTPNSFVALPKFYWVQQTFGGHIDVDGFVMLFKLHIQKKKVVFDDEVGTFENHFGCCSFNTWRKNERQRIKRVELSYT